jgi:hypothetical protein
MTANLDYQTLVKLPYSLDPYGYARRLTRSLTIGGKLVGATSPDDAGKTGNRPIRLAQNLAVNPTADPLFFLEQLNILAGSGSDFARFEIAAAPSAFWTILAKFRLETEAGKPSGVTSPLPIIGTVSEREISALEKQVIGQCAAVGLSFGRSTPTSVLEKLLQICDDPDQNLLLEVIEDAPQKLELPDLQVLVDQTLEMVSVARQHGFHNLLLSAQLNNKSPHSTLHYYRLLAALLAHAGKDWNYPLWLNLNLNSNNPSFVASSAPSISPDFEAAAAILAGSLLEDGIGDVLQLGGSPSSLLHSPTAPANSNVKHRMRTEAALGLQLIRRITAPEPANLEKAGLTDASSLVIAQERANHESAALSLLRRRSPYGEQDIEVANYPYIRVGYSDVRSFYEAKRRRNRVVHIGSVALGGEHTPAVIANLVLQQNLALNATEAENEFDAEQELDPEMVWDKTDADIYFVNRLSDPVRRLRRSGELNKPVVVGVQSVAEVQSALELGVDGLLFCLDTVGQIGGEEEELEAVLETLQAAGRTDLPLILVSTHNAGQSWGSYDYWSSFMEARQVPDALRLCESYGLNNLVVGIYTYHAAWCVQNVRAMAALLHEENLDYPIHLMASDPPYYYDYDANITDVILQEIRLDAYNSVGNLLIDGIGDSLQTDYAPLASFNGDTTADRVYLFGATAHALRQVCQYPTEGA